jgi:hypothetical protein
MAVADTRVWTELNGDYPRGLVGSGAHQFEKRLVDFLDALSAPKPRKSNQGVVESGPTEHFVPGDGHG